MKKTSGIIAIILSVVLLAAGNVRSETGPVDYPVYTKAIESKILHSLDAYVDSFPHVSPENSFACDPEPNDKWSSAFYIGEVYLTCEATGNETFFKYADAYLDSFEERLNREAPAPKSHDLGFLYTVSCVNLYNATGNERAKELAVKAADALLLRYNEQGTYIQAWGSFNKGDPYVYMIIDTMMNLPLLYWASEITGNPRYAEIASSHAETTIRYLVRDDYSTFHTYLMDPTTGLGMYGKTRQGYSDDSTWARGQAWAVYGFSLAYRYTGDTRFLETARGCADYNLKNLPADFVPYWDFTFTDDDPDIRDTSAGSILACGLLELSEHTQDMAYRDAAKNIVDSLCGSYFIEDTDTVWLLSDGMYHREEGSISTAWGDYFFYEALLKTAGITVSCEI